MPILKFMNGDLYSMDSLPDSPLTAQAVENRLIEDGLMTNEQSLKAIDPETEKVHTKADILEDKLYLALIGACHVLKWLDVSKLHFTTLSGLSHAMPLLKENRHRINWSAFSKNTHPEAIEMIIQEDKYYLESLCANPSAISFFKAYPEKVDWDIVLTQNPNPEVIPLFIEKYGMEEFKEKILDKNMNFKCFAHPDAVPYIKMFETELKQCFRMFRNHCLSIFRNPSKEVVPMLTERLAYDYERVTHVLSYFPERLICAASSSNEDMVKAAAEFLGNGPDFYYKKVVLCDLSRNSVAIPYLKQYPQLIHLPNLCGNPTVEAMEMIAEQIEKHSCATLLKEKRLCLRSLSLNHYAVPLLEKYPELIEWTELSTNPSAVSLLENNIDKIKWNHIIFNPNPNALELIPKHCSKPIQLFYENISNNVGIFLNRDE
jgi:hypothetical protein